VVIIGKRGQGWVTDEQSLGHQRDGTGHRQPRFDHLEVRLALAAPAKP
jgi:hypothetical protein